MTNRKRPAIAVTLSPAAIEMCEELAAKDGLTRSAFIEMLIRREHNRQDRGADEIDALQLTERQRVRR